MRFWGLAGQVAVGVALATTTAATAAQAAPCAYAAGAAMVAVPGRPFAAVPSADGCWLFVSMLGATSASEGGGVAVLKNAGGRFQVARTQPLPGGPAGIALTHDGRTLVVAAQDSVAILDVARLESGEAGAVTALLAEDAGAGAIYAATSLDDRLLFVAEERRDRIEVLDLAQARTAATKSVVGYIPQGRAPVGLAVSADGRRLYATSEIANAAGLAAPCAPQVAGRGRNQPQGALSVIDVDMAGSDPGKALVGAAMAGCGPVRVALSPDGAMAWVTARGDDRLLGFATAKLSAAGAAGAPQVSIQVGSAPVGVAARPDGAQVWVADSDRFAANGACSLTAVSPQGAVLRTVPSGRFPRDLRFLPDGKTLVAAVFGSRAVQFVPTDGP
jgi:DNA-binding beta-propeller fold protein YncE